VFRIGFIFGWVIWFARTDRRKFSMFHATFFAEPSALERSTPRNAAAITQEFRVVVGKSLTLNMIQTLSTQHCASVGFDCSRRQLMRPQTCSLHRPRTQRAAGHRTRRAEASLFIAGKK
jgi:hypothetical protein